MNKPRRTISFLSVFLFAFIGLALAQQDEKNCKDHPLFTRIPNFYIFECKESPFDRADFKDEQGNEIQVEGKIHFTDYRIKQGYQPPSSLQIVRNYQNAIQKIDGAIVYENLHWYDTYLKLTKGGKTYWVFVDANSTGDGKNYELTIVEKSAMPQEIVADAKTLMNDISTTGHASIYGIYFDFNKTDVKPESEPAIREIAKLLQDSPGLKLYVVGHTDNVGSIDYNMKLSKARADAVTKELLTKYGIPSDTLKAFGVGSLAPVASNKTDEGRAKNRRVELVEQ